MRVSFGALTGVPVSYSGAGLGAGPALRRLYSMSPGWSMVPV